MMVTGKVDYLEVLQGSVQGALGLMESLADTPRWHTIQVLRNAVGLLHQSQGVLRAKSIS